MSDPNLGAILASHSYGRSESVPYRMTLCLYRNVSVFCFCVYMFPNAMLLAFHTSLMCNSQSIIATWYKDYFSGGFALRVSQSSLIWPKIHYDPQGNLKYFVSHLILLNLLENPMLCKLTTLTPSCLKQTSKGPWGLFKSIWHRP